MKNPLVSVIVPTRNSAGFLSACLTSIKNQTYKNIEIVIVDNYSIDKTKIIAKSLRHSGERRDSRIPIKFYSHGPERSAQRNFGAKKSRGKYLLFIDSDMELSKEVVGECIEKIQVPKNKSQTKRKIAGIIIPEESFGEGFWAQCKKLERSFYVGVDWIEAARFYDKKIFIKLGGFDENLIAGEDWDLSQRAGILGNLQRIKYFIRHNEGKLTFSQTISKKYAYSKVFSRYSEKEINRKFLQKQTSIGERYKLFFSNPEKLFANPFVSLGMFFMKSVEFVFGGYGYLFQSKQIEIQKDSVKNIIPNNRLPSVSFIIPTYNAEKYLDLCLKSIKKQDYPSDKVEILIIDGGSTDRTLEISNKYRTNILRNPKKIAEYGKAIGIRASKGEYFILMDADNEIVEKGWLKKMVKPIMENPSLFGVESPLSFDKKLSSLNRYFARMRIADPLAKYLASKPERISKGTEYDILEFKKNAILITGANGFLWNKKLVIKTGGWKEKFEEANYSTWIHSKTNANYAIPYDCFIRHYYCQNIRDYIQKRIKIAQKVKLRIQNREFLWINKSNTLRNICISLYLITIVGPLIEGLYKSIKYRTSDWLWHPFVCFVTIIIYAFYIIN